MKKFPVLFILLFWLSHFIFAQVTDSKNELKVNGWYYVKLRKKIIYAGKVVEKSTTSMTIEVKGEPNREIAYSAIKELYAIDSSKITKEGYLHSNIDASKYLFSPSAFTLPKKKYVYSTAYFLIHKLEYGATDNFSFGVGSFLYYRTAHVTAKVKIVQTEEATFSIGGILFPYLINSLYAQNPAVYGILTIGSAENNVSLGAGSVLFEESRKETEIVFFNFIFRLSPKRFFIMDNIIIPEIEPKGEIRYEGISTVMIRSIRNKNAFNFGLIVLPGQFAFPYIGYAKQFD